MPDLNALAGPARPPRSRAGSPGCVRRVPLPWSPWPTGWSSSAMR